MRVARTEGQPYGVNAAIADVGTSGATSAGASDELALDTASGRHPLGLLGPDTIR